MDKAERKTDEVLEERLEAHASASLASLRMEVVDESGPKPSRII